MRVVHPFGGGDEAACALLRLRLSHRGPCLDLAEEEAEADVVATASEMTGNAPPPFHIPLSDAALRAGRRFFPPFPRPSVQGLYHGTSGRVADLLLAGADLAPSGEATRPMLGPAHYLGDYLKAMRFAQYDADWNVRGDGALLRYLVYLPDARRVLRAPFDADCDCGCAPHLRRYVDHGARWKETADAAYIPAGCEWSEGRFVSRNREIAVADPSRLLLVGGARVDARTAFVPRDPTFRRHSVLLNSLHIRVPRHTRR